MLSSLASVFLGTVSVGSVMGVRVRLHASVLWFVALMFLLVPGTNGGVGYFDVATGVCILAALLVVHEVGHCTATAQVGGRTDEIVLWPLGGLAGGDVPPRPLPTFLAAAGGLLANLAVSLMVGLALWLLTRGAFVPNPLHVKPAFGHTTPAYYLAMTFSVSSLMVLLNLLPAYPMDGGQMLQAMLWNSLGHYRSVYGACVTGMATAGVLVLAGLFSASLLLVVLGGWLLISCHEKLRVLTEMGEEVFEDPASDSDDWETARRSRRRRLSRRAIRRMRRRAQQEQQEQARIDMILDKVAAHGMASLTWRERRALRKATERQRRDDAEAGRVYRET